MILRSVMKHVRDQNWFAVFLDFLIVVVGVFIGIQVANWNEQRQDRRTGSAYLERIQDDLAVDRMTLEQRGEFWAVVHAYGEGALAYLESGTLVGESAWQTLLAFYHATQIWGFSLYDSTYREMTSSGELGLIPDPDLRRALGDYYAAGLDQRYDLFQLIPPYRDTVRGMTPWAIQNYIWATCFESLRLDHFQLLDCEAPVPPDQAQRVLDELAGRSELVEELRNWLRNLELMLIWQGQLVETSGDLSQRIDRTLDGANPRRQGPP